MALIMGRVFLLCAAVFLHECAHVAAARCFGVKTEKIRLSPLGGTAHMTRFAFLPAPQKAAVLLAGPAVNLAIGLALLLIFPYQFVFFRNANLVIGLFNLMPALPLDGGRLLYLALDGWMGLLPANRAVYAVSRVVSGCFILLGLVQVVLHPYNISLICMGLYTAYRAKTVHFDTIFDFYKHLILSSVKLSNSRALPVKQIALTADTPIKAVLQHIGYQHLLVVCVLENGRPIRQVNETDITAHIRAHGTHGALQIVCGATRAASS